MKRPKTRAPQRIPSPLRLVTLAVVVLFGLLLFLRPGMASAASDASTPPTPPPTPPSYANVPLNPIVGAPAIQSATGGPITQDDVTRFVQSHHLPGNFSKDQGSIILVLKLSSQDLVGLLNTPTGLPDDTQLWYVEWQGQFIFPGSSAQTDGLRFPNAFEVFLADTGNEIMDGGLAQPTGNPTGGPTPTPMGTSTPTTAPTATPTIPSTQPTATPRPQPTATSRPQPTATPVQHTCRQVGASSARLNVDIPYFDFDAGLQHTSVQATDDVHYLPAQASTFTAINGTAIFEWGSGSPPCSDYLSVNYQAGGTVPVQAGKTYMMRTNGGHIAVFTVTSFSSDIISISWATYTVS
jgi:cell division septation protein DedD